MSLITRRIMIMAALAALLPAFVWAQPPEPHRGRARTFLVLRLAEVLNLPDEKALKVSSILRGVEKQRRDLRRRRNDVEEKLRAALEKAPPEAGKLKDLVAEANRIDREHALLPEKSFLEVQKILTPQQQAKLILFRPDLEKEIRGAVRRRLEMRRPLRPRPGAEQF